MKSLLQRPRYERDEMFLIHNHDNTYWENTDALADEIGELRLQKAVLAHTAWLSVDAMGTSEHAHQPSVKLRHRNVGFL